jgi:hypothetical protein
MPFTPPVWKSYPDTSTPVTKEKLDLLGTQYDRAVEDAKAYVDSGQSGGISEVTYALLPAGTTITVTKTGTTWPPRPTPRADIVVRWKGSDPGPTIGGLYFLDGIDIREVPVSKAGIGLENVDNTSDMNKPVSTAQRAAIDSSAAAAVSSIRLWNKTTRTWPAVGSAPLPVMFMSTNDPTADIPTAMRVDFDVWIPHVDATNA